MSRSFSRTGDNDEIEQDYLSIEAITSKQDRLIQTRFFALMTLTLTR